MGKRNKTDMSGDIQIKKKKTTITDKKEVDVIDDSTIHKVRKNKKKDKTVLEKTESTNKDCESILQPDTMFKNTKKFKIKEKDQVNLKNAPSKQRKSEKSFKDTHPNPEEIVNEDSKLDDIVPQLEKTRKPKKFKNKRVGYDKGDKTCSLPSKKSKKIIFVDDEPSEVPETVNIVKQKKFLNDDEEEVNDEDIDKFCDEIDEKDNEQYEDWIKLIEAKLHENKKIK